MKKSVKEAITNISLFCVTCLVLILFIEVVLQLTHPPHLKYQYDEKLQWKIKPNQEAHPRFGLPVATINEEGFRGENIQDKESILILGDSFSFGWGVENSETYAEVLKKMLNEEYEVINTAVPGWGVSQIHDRFHQVHQQYNSSYVVLLLIAEDFYRISEENRREQYSRTNKVRGILSHSLIMSFIESKTYKVLNSKYPKMYSNSSADLQKVIEKQVEYVHDIDKKVSEEGKKFIIMLYPQFPGTTNRTFETAFRSAFEGKASVIELGDFFTLQKRSKEELTLPEGHPSPSSHKIIAETLFDIISSEKGQDE